MTDTTILLVDDDETIRSALRDLTRDSRLRSPRAINCYVSESIMDALPAWV
jgi:FixJ family two-component response regulator